MIDPRIERLADVLIGHSTEMKKGEHVLFELFDVPESIGLALVRAARRVGANPHIAWRSQRLMSELVNHNDEAQVATWGAYDTERMKRMDAYIGVRGSSNINEMAGIPSETMGRFTKHYANPVHFEERVNRTRWCVLRWPTGSMAQLAGMNTEAFEQFYFDVCTLDYGRMSKAAEGLAERMRRTDRVQIKGPGDTDLSFSIKDIPVIPCCGNANIPDGEVFTAPVRESVNGVIHYNTPTIYHGQSFENIRLEFRDGKIVNVAADKGADAINAILDTDAGGRYVGEFAVGFNPYIMEPMRDILFDEKIAGSIHFTPGRAYEEADNGNRSEIHWDLVLIQRADRGGGTLVFDDEVVRRDGIFVVPDLEPLNPDALTA